MPTLNASEQNVSDASRSLALRQLLEVELESDLRRAAKDFTYFVYVVFAASFDEFVTGDYIKDVCATLTASNRTMDVTGRDHFKSMRLYARAMWLLLNKRYKGHEGWYFSYNADMAGYHLAKVKTLIRRNIYFQGITDNKPKAESVLDYQWGDNPRITFNAAGLLAFNRGIHGDSIFVDDPLRDPTDKLKPLAVLHINTVMASQILPMVNKGGECRVVGTPQTWEDFFFDKRLRDDFNVSIQRAVVDEKNGIAIWPEWKSFDELMKLRRQMGVKIFNQEYNAEPAYSEESYISRGELLTVTKDIASLPATKHYPELENEIVVAGHDVGKRSHPSHFAVFVRFQVEDKVTYRQIHSKWMDGWDYMRQLDYITQTAEYFNISLVRYDNTRGEFEAFAEQKKLPRYFKPMTFSAKTKNAMASHLASVVTQQRIELINEHRQFNQILAVTNDLDAMVSPDGHGDAFWSVGMAIYEEARAQPNVRWL